LFWFSNQPKSKDGFAGLLKHVHSGKWFGYATLNALKVRVRSKPIEGKANKEIEQELSRVLGAEVKIISGGKSRNKKIIVKGKAVVEKLARYKA